MRRRLFHRAALLSFLVFGWLNISQSFGQKLQATQPFDISTPYIEPDGRREVLKLTDNSFVVATKTKGAIAGDADYVLKRLSPDLQTIFKKDFILPDNEEIKEMYYLNNKIFIVFIIHDTEEQTSTLLAKSYDLSNGSELESITLRQTKIGKWHEENKKGAVKLTFENYVGSVIGQNYITPPDYQYEITFSPDSSKILTYIFDYSQKTLVAQCVVYDNKLQKIKEGNIPIDNNFVNYGLYLNNAGEVIILNGDRLGRIVVVEYNLEDHSNKFLDIQYASAFREGLKLKIVSNDIIYVGNVVTNKNGILLAAMYSKFNFKTQRVEKVNYHTISDSLKQVANDVRNASKFHGEENWMNYELTDFIIDAQERVTMVLEKREIQSKDFTYNHAGVLDIYQWIERTGKVSAEAIVVMCFDKAENLLFETYFPKAQEADITSGLNSASFSLDNSKQGKLRLLFTTADNASGIFNTLHYLEWDEATGTLLKNTKLENPEGMGLLRNYTIWYKDKLILCGRKGLMGKKSFISSYTLE